ncbi:hypothetical protein GCM10010402_66140 [Actinomadura luteofluorescens]|uniref:hypothetical protein n=1 Tax=Actinomadura luteofluorescens TaxID=46163 RepID=UPI002164965F|nr:hypothetical protein [Actinomadura glauciflava]MCR3744214.1 hypothetical protein [Actinomadura glauciflava]
MPRMPRWMLTHRVSIEPFEGDGATGAVYGPPVEGVRALAVAKTTTVRTADGKTTVSDTTVVLLPGQACPPRSRITLPGGRQVIAVTVTDADGGGLPTPDHVEAVCI